MSNAVNGFKKCGIWPYDSNIFTEADFVASMTTDIEVTPSTVDIASQGYNNEGTNKLQTEKTNSISVNYSEPGCSFWHEETQAREPLNPVQQSVFALVSPKQLLPVPVTQQKKRTSRKRGKSAIITSSPYKKALAEDIRKKEEIVQEKERRKIERQRKKEEKGNNKEGKRKDEKPLSNKTKTKATKYHTKLVRIISSDSEDETNNTPCLYCNERYLQSVEGWIMCLACEKWAHCSCAGVDEDDAGATHVCALCLPD